MRKKCSTVLLLGFTMIPLPLLGAEAPKLLDPVVVTATRTETPVTEILGSCTVITAEEIEARQYATVLEAVQATPGVVAARAGGWGQQSSIFLRGANSEHLLVLIDGMVVNDPSLPSRSFDFAHLTTDNIERIEILRGPQSVLYGSDAMAGVIQIITKKGSGKPSLQVTAEGGSFRTFRETAASSGGNERLNYSLSLSRIDSDGISAASEADGNRERDGYRANALALRLGVNPTPHAAIDLIGRYLESSTELDNFGGPMGDDPNNELDWKSWQLRLQGRWRPLGERWETKAAVSAVDNDRVNDNNPDAGHPDALLRSSYDSRLYKAEWQNDIRLGENHLLTMGAEYQDEKMKSRYYEEGSYTFMGTTYYFTDSSEFRARSKTTAGLFVQEQFQFRKTFFATLGMRLDDHESFGSHATWKIAAAYVLPQTQTRFSASFGTGFKAPSLYQLYADSSYVQGNVDLDPEQSRGWEARLEQPFLERRLVLNATYFRNDFKDLITTELDTASWRYAFVNINEARTRGFELEALFQPRPELEFSASYTRTEAENLDSGEDLVRRPRHKFALQARYRFLETAGAELELCYVGKRKDTFYNEATSESGPVKLDPYTLVNLALHWDLTPHLRLFGRVENLLDEDYVEVWGYGTPGIGAYTGLRLRL
ncbi:MAG: TonB-dependent receptor [Deltaproteobacteria bacterium]|nr:TonB-dependent receptor [Deltaproteobacteria bacterium]